MLEAKPETTDRTAPPNSEPVVRTIAMPAEANPAGDIFGGWIMSQMDLAGASLATRRAQGRCATVAVDSMSFLSPVYVGDEVSLYGRMVHEGHTSMKVAIEAWRRHRESDEMIKVTDAVFTYVAIDKDRRPRPLP